jgi:hypothetical protein
VKKKRQESLVRPSLARRISAQNKKNRPFQLKVTEEEILEETRKENSGNAASQTTLEQNAEHTSVAWTKNRKNGIVSEEDTTKGIRKTTTDPGGLMIKNGGMMTEIGRKETGTGVETTRIETVEDTATNHRREIMQISRFN